MDAWEAPQAAVNIDARVVVSTHARGTGAKQFLEMCDGAALVIED
jgi:hypothetical protein